MPRTWPSSAWCSTYKKAEDGTLSYYVFYMYGDGYYGAKRVVGDQVDIALPLTKSDLIDVGSANSLGVEAQGSRFDLFINGKHIDGFTDLKLDGGGFGFYISKRSEGAFDDFVVKVEKRDTGQEPPDEPNSADDGASSVFGSYSPPYIPKDPNRPVYPWEVGVDKSKKGKQKAAKKARDEEQELPRVEDDPGAEGSAPTEGPGVKQEPARPKVEPGKKKRSEDSEEQDKPKPKPKAKPPAKPAEDEAKPEAPAEAPPAEAPPREDPPREDPPREDPPPAPSTEDEAHGDNSPLPPPALDLPEAPQPPVAEELVLPLEPEPQPSVAEETQPAPADPAPAAGEYKATVEAQPEVKPEAAPNPEPDADKPAAPAPANKQSSQAQPRADSHLDGMRAKQDDWMDPNLDSPVVEEVRAPAPERPAAKVPKQEVPQQDESDLQLPEAPGVAGADSTPAEPAAGTPDGALALLPPTKEPDAAAAPPQPEPVPEAAPVAPPAAEAPLELAPEPEPGSAGADSAPRVLVDPSQQLASADPTQLSELPPMDTPLVATPEPLPDAAPVAAQPATLPPPAPADPDAVQINDDFSQQLWAVADGEASTYRYFGAAYEINNLEFRHHGAVVPAGDAGGTESRLRRGVP